METRYLALVATLSVVCLAKGTLIGCSEQQAPEKQNSPRSEQLLDRIEKLEARVAQLEKRPGQLVIGSSFDDTYDQWRKEKQALMADASAGKYTIPHGETDPSTGKFTPSRIMVLECQLGQEAHLHEAFLRKTLEEDAEVHRILEKSRRLCEKYEISSAAYVLFEPEKGYISRARDGLAPQQRQAIWLKAMSKEHSQPKLGEFIKIEVNGRLGSSGWMGGDVGDTKGKWARFVIASVFVGETEMFLDLSKCKAAEKEILSWAERPGRFNLSVLVIPPRVKVKGTLKFLKSQAQADGTKPGRSNIPVVVVESLELIK